MSNQYNAVAAILQSAITSTNTILTSAEDEMHRIRITQQLQLLTDQLLLITGTGDLQTGQTTVLGPATTIGGKPIGKVRKFTADDMIPSDDKVNNLKKQVEAAISYFGPEANAAGILANIPELIIRGVAKKAGLKVTKDEPKELTVEFVEQIKKALVENGITGEVNEDDEEDDDKEVAASIGNLAPAADSVQTFETKSAPAETIPPVNETKAAVVETKAEHDFEEEAPLKQVIDALKASEQKAAPAQEQKSKSETDTKKKTGK